MSILSLRNVAKDRYRRGDGILILWRIKFHVDKDLQYPVAWHAIWSLLLKPTMSLNNSLINSNCELTCIRLRAWYIQMKYAVVFYVDNYA